MLTLAQTISQSVSVCSYDMSVLRIEILAAISSPTPVPVLWSFRHSFKLSGKTWLSVIEGYSHVYEIRFRAVDEVFYSVLLFPNGLAVDIQDSIVVAFWRFLLRVYTSFWS